MHISLHASCADRLPPGWSYHTRREVPRARTTRGTCPSARAPNSLSLVQGRSWSDSHARPHRPTQSCRAAPTQHWEAPVPCCHSRPAPRWREEGDAVEEGPSFSEAMRRSRGHGSKLLLRGGLLGHPRQPRCGPTFRRTLQTPSMGVGAGAEWGMSLDGVLDYQTRTSSLTRTRTTWWASTTRGSAELSTALS